MDGVETVVEGEPSPGSMVAWLVKLVPEATVEEAVMGMVRVKVDPTGRGLAKVNVVSPEASVTAVTLEVVVLPVALVKVAVKGLPPP